jgi:hypothetical protein
VTVPRILALLLVLALLAWYLSFSASRLDRLHHRVEGARAALDAQLVRRAEAAVELATSGALDPASGLLLADAAARALESGEHGGADEPAEQNGHGGPGRGVAGGAARERAESDLTRALRATVTPDLAVASDPRIAALLARLATTGHRAQLARRFLNGAVTDAGRVRGKWVVRWVRLAGTAPMPETFEMDDDPPAPLTS